MTKAKKVIGCVQHDCAECKTMRRVYEAAMACTDVLTLSTFNETTVEAAMDCAAAIRALKK